MGDNIEVAIRVRPILDKELNEGLSTYWQITGQNIFQIDEQRKPSTQPFKFDHIFGGEKNNSEIFQAVVQPMIRSGMVGYNATVFAYGQAASGKTYTMLGSGSDQGIIPLTIEDIFESINSNLARKFLLRLSYIEIYNDTIYDLLDTTKKTVKILEDGFGAVHLNVEEKVIQTTEQAHVILKEGEKLRRYGATNANQRSNRSHAIFRIIIESSPLNDDPDSDLPVHVSHLNFVDLAGSVRASQTKATGPCLHEGGQINKSLYVLSLVIRQLSEGKDFTNFRDSKLTRILKESLGGNAKTLIIGAITPTSVEDSHSTLTFTYQAKNITNKPTINEVIGSKTSTKQYIQKEKELQKQLAEMAKDKKELEDKHVRTVSDLIDKLHHFEHQFIISRNKEVKEEGNRRHTIGPSNIPKATKRFKPALKCATEQRNPKLRKRPPSPQDNLLGASCLPQNVAIPSDVESKQIHEVYKRVQDLIAADISKSPEKENRQSILESVAKMYNEFCNVQTKIKMLQNSVDSDQEACSGATESMPQSEAQENFVTGERSIMEEEEPASPCASDAGESITPTSIKTEVTDFIEPKLHEPAQLDNFKPTELLEENKLLKEQITNLTRKLKTAQQANSALKLNLETNTLKKRCEELQNENKELEQLINDQYKENLHKEQAISERDKTITEMDTRIADFQCKLKTHYELMDQEDVIDSLVKDRDLFAMNVEKLERQLTASYQTLYRTEKEYNRQVEEIDNICQEKAMLRTKLIEERRKCKQLLEKNKEMLRNFTEQRQRTVQVSEEKQQLETLNAKFANKQHLLEENIIKQVQERIEFGKKNAMLQDKIAEQNHLIIKYSNEIELLENCITKQNQQSVKLIEDMKTLKANLALHVTSNAKTSQEIQVLQGKMTKYLKQEKDTGKLAKDNSILQYQLNEQKQLSATYALLENSIAQQESANTKLIEEKKVLQEKLTQQEQFNIKLADKKQQLENTNANLIEGNNNFN